MVCLICTGWTHGGYPPTPLLGITWSHSPITWAFATPASAAGKGLGTVSNEITNSAQKTAVRNGMNAWAAVSNVQLSEIATPATADIQVGYADLTGLLGQANWNYTPGPNTFNFTLLQLEDPAISPLAVDGSGNLAYVCCVAWLQQVTTHEAGVLLGLGEDTEPTSILNHVQGTSNRIPNYQDIASMRGLYP